MLSSEGLTILLEKPWPITTGQLILVKGYPVSWALVPTLSYKVQTLHPAFLYDTVHQSLYTALQFIFHADVTGIWTMLRTIDPRPIDCTTF